MTDFLEGVRKAETEIQGRKQIRDSTTTSFREALAQELIADEMTRAVAELRVIRILLATMSAKARWPQS